MARKIKFKTNWKKILCAILAVILCITVIGGIAALAKDETKSISSTEFTRGALDENGKYVKSDQSIYTEEAFGCIGLRVQPDFEANSTFDVYYYDYDGKFIEAKLGLSETYDEDSPLAKTARIVIHPEIPEDVDKDEFKIAFYEVYGIANQFDITVNKKQNYKYENSVNLYDAKTSVEGFSITDNSGNRNTVSLVENEHARTSNAVSVNGEYEYYDVYIKCIEPLYCYVNAAFGDAEGNVFSGYSKWIPVDELKDGEWRMLTLEVPDEDTVDHLRVSFPKNCEVIIYGYND